MLPLYHPYLERGQMYLPSSSELLLPFVLIPAFGVPRSLVLHGYTFWLLVKRRAEKAIQL